MRAVNIVVITAALIAPAARAEVKDFVPVTQQMLINPRAEDWLMFSRTYDAQRFSRYAATPRQLRTVRR